MIRREQTQDVGHGAFDRLMRKLIHVPKHEVDEQQRKHEQEQAKKREQQKPRKSKK